MHFEKVTAGQFYADCPFENPYMIEECWEDIKLPTRSTENSAGYDFYIPFDITIRPNEWVTIPTGIRWICNKPERDRVLLIAPRSGLGFKYQTRLANTLGVIDSDYSNAANEGDIIIKMTANERLRLKAGEKFCQGIIVPLFTCDDDDASGARNGGFGSTGR